MRKKELRRRQLDAVLEQLLPPELTVSEGRVTRELLAMVKGWNDCRESMRGRAAALLNELH